MGVSVEIIQPGMFAGVVADELVASMNDAILERGRCSLVLAGGRSPSSIYRTMAVSPRADEVDWSKVTLYWTDERWVPREDNQSNYRLIQETLLSRLPGGKSPGVCGVDTTLKSPEEGAKAYAASILKSEGLKKGEMPVFDVALLGVGTDGHTASLFPESPLLSSKGKIAHAVVGPGDAGPRVTLSAEVLFSARRILFIAMGDRKAEITKRVLEGTEDVSAVPARLYATVEDQVSFYVDSEAAKKLSSGWS